MIETLEDIVETMCTDSNLIEQTDYKLFKSIHKQIQNGVSLTDRQCDLIRKKTQKYQTVLGEVTDGATHITRMPIRKVDRSRIIRVVNYAPGHNRTIGSRKLQPAITIRFLFKKSILHALDRIRKELSICNRIQDEKTHYFPYTERNLEYIVNQLKPMHFEMDSSTQLLYETICNFSKETCLVSVYNGKLHNATPTQEQIIQNDLGPITETSLLRYADRALQYGIEHIDSQDIKKAKSHCSVLAGKIATRRSRCVFINSQSYTHEHLVSSLYELGRERMLIILPKHNGLNELNQYLKHLSHIAPDQITIIPWSEQTPMNEYGTTVHEMTRCVFVVDTDNSYTYTYTWSPQAIVIPQSTKISRIIRNSTLFADHDLVINYGSRINTQLSERHRRLFGRIEKL